MTWFVASIVSVIQSDSGVQDDYPIYEDHYLVEASSKDELDKKVDEIAKTIDAAGECEYKGEKARQICIGVRKIRSVYNPTPLDIDADRPTSGTELTHSFLVTSSLEEAKSFADGGAVQIWCVDDAE
jgi:hypothetical protein